MNIKPNQKKKQRGFSLVELLVVVAVIGVLAAIAMLSFGDVNGVSRKVTAQNKAQRIASLFNAGISAGAPAFLSAASVEEAMNAVGQGANGAGALSSSHFRMAGTSSTMDDGSPAAEQAKHYLSWNGTLIYNGTGNGGGGGSSSTPSTPPPNWLPFGAGDVGNLMVQAVNNTGNSSLTVQQAVAWFNAQPNQPVVLMEQNGMVFYSFQNQGSSGGNSSQN